MTLTKGTKMNRAKNKATAKRIELPYVAQAKQEVTPPTWQSLSDAKPGLNVMKGSFNNELVVVRIHRIDRGVDVVAQVFTADFQPVHVLVAEQAQYQKIKE